MATEEEILVSPRLVALRRATESGDGAPLAAFWREVAAQGAPLIEPIDGDDRYVLVTFLWRAQGATRNVVVEGGLDGWGLDMAASRMRQLAGTDLWYQTRRTRADVRTTYQLAPNDPLTSLAAVDDWAARTAHWQPDPLNLRTFIFPSDDKLSIKESAVSVLEGPQAVPQPWVDVRPEVPVGTVERHAIHSDRLGNDRLVWVYTPPGYTADGEPYGLVVVFDGWAYLRLVPTPTILDNLLAAGVMPPLVALLVNNADGDSRDRELPCHPPFVDFLTQELLPWARAGYHITSDPARTVVAGSSYGGLAAAFAGLRRPDVFGNVLSQSGAFWWKPVDDHEEEWLTRQYAAAPTAPVRVYLEAGLLEDKSDAALSILVANRHLRTVLRAKGYAVRHAEFSGGHSYLNWRGTLADGLLALVGYGG